MSSLLSGGVTPKATTIAFTCQRCMLPIKLDHSFNSIDEHTLAELHLPLYAPQPLGLDESNSLGLVDKYIPPLGLGIENSNSHGFTIVGNLVRDNNTTSPQSHQLRVNAKLMDFLSENTEIDHPLCEECCDTLITLLDNELRAAEEECNQYQEFLNKLESEPDTEDIEALEAQLQDLQTEERTLRDEIKDLRIAEATAEENLKRQKVETERLRVQEQQFFKEYCRHKRQLSETEDQHLSLDNELRYVEGQLERLGKTNALNATFHIWHNGHFATINTFRLGRLPSEPVDWNEINAAWGQTILLLNSLARKINFKFSGYQLVPFGNHSYIKVLDDNSELPLYITRFRFMRDTKFDQGMAAFLECLRQLQAAMLEKPGHDGFALPYRMTEKGKIEDPTSGKSYSVKLQLNSEEQWSKALKFMMTNLKWALAWVSSQTIQDVS